MAKREEWWRGAFDGGVYPLGAIVASREFQRDTPRQMRFLKRALGLRPGTVFLDVGCGVGRHAVAAAEAGCRVTGADISRPYLASAVRSAVRRGVEAEFVRLDMRELPWRGRFDAAVNLFSSFGYFEKASDDLRVLRGVARGLKPGGRFLLDTMDPAWLGKNFQPRVWSELADGSFALQATSWLTGRRRIRTRWTMLKGARRSEMESTVRIYTAARLEAVFRKAGLKVERRWGDLFGAAYRPGKSRRLVFLGRKPAAGVHCGTARPRRTRRRR